MEVRSWNLDFGHLYVAWGFRPAHWRYIHRKTQRRPAIESTYLTTEITEFAEDTEISVFYLRLSSAVSAISALKI